jgi:hypothetical protein
MLFSKNNNVAAPTINGRNKYESVEHYFLAIAKDVRYVQQCTDLLGHILGPSSARTSRILAEYMSWILYILLTTKSAILRREGQTLQTATTTPGMEVCQLKYVQESVPLEKTALWSRLSSVLLRNTSLTTVALFSVTLLYGIRFQSERIMQRTLSALSLSPDQYQGQARRNVYLLQRKEMIRRGRDIVSGIAEAPSNTTDATNLKKPDGKSTKMYQIKDPIKHLCGTGCFRDCTRSCGPLWWPSIGRCSPTSRVDPMIPSLRRPCPRQRPQLLLRPWKTGSGRFSCGFFSSIWPAIVSLENILRFYIDS